MYEYKTPLIGTSRMRKCLTPVPFEAVVCFDTLVHYPQCSNSSLIFVRYLGVHVFRYARKLARVRATGGTKLAKHLVV